MLKEASAIELCSCMPFPPFLTGYWFNLFIHLICLFIHLYIYLFFCNF